MPAPTRRAFIAAVCSHCAPATASAAATFSQHVAYVQRWLIPMDVLPDTHVVHPRAWLGHRPHVGSCQDFCYAVQWLSLRSCLDVRIRIGLMIRDGLTAIHVMPVLFERDQATRGADVNYTGTSAVSQFHDFKPYAYVQFPGPTPNYACSALPVVRWHIKQRRVTFTKPRCTTGSIQQVITGGLNA